MAKKIFSCARANFFRRDESSEQAWSWIVGMFNDPHGKNSKSFIPAGYRLKPLKEKNDTNTRLGEIFKYATMNGSEMYVEITHWKPFETLTYTENWAPTSGKYVNHISAKAPPNIMKFSLEKHYEGTKVFIERVEIGLFSIKDRVINTISGGFDQNSCTGRLTYILTGKFPKGSRYEDNTYIIERDDSLKNLKAS